MTVSRLISIKIAAIDITALLLVTTVAAQDECQQADAFAEAKLFDQGLSAYEALLQERPGLACAQEGIEKIAQQREEAYRNLVRGQALENAGQAAASIQAYTAALAIDPQLTSASSALAKLITESSTSSNSGDPFNTARALAAAGLEDAARKNIIETIQDTGKQLPKGDDLRGVTDPFFAVRRLADAGLFDAASAQLSETVKTTDLQVPSDLRYLLNAKISPQERLGSKAFSGLSIGRVAVEGLAIFLAVILGVIAIIFFLDRIRRWLIRPSLNVKEFDDGAIDVKIGKGMPTVVEESLSNLAGSSTIDLLQASRSLSLPATVEKAIGTTSPYLAAIPALVQYIWPPRTKSLTGQLLRSDRSGAGLSLSLVGRDSNSIISSVLLWETDYGPKSSDSKATQPFFDLAETAATWTWFQLQSSRETGGQTKSRNHRSSWVGTNNWRSYALFRAGARWETRDKMDSARRYYRRALEADANNPLPMILLARVYMRDKQTKDNEDDPKRQSQPQGNDSEDNEYKWAENLLKDAINQLGQSEPEKDLLWYGAMYWLAAVLDYQGRSEEACTWAEKLCSEMFAQGKGSGWVSNGDELYPVALAMYAGVLANRGDEGKSKEQVDQISEDIRRTRSRVQYNLACFETARGKLLNSRHAMDKKKDHLDAALKYLKESLRRHPSFERGARIDPSLVYLKKERRTEFDEIIRAAGASDGSATDTLPLAKLPMFSEKLAEALKACDVTSPEDLILKARTAEDRTRLSSRVSVGPQILYNAARLAELTLIDELTIEITRLLFLAEVDSLGVLQRSDVEDLQRLLSDVNSARSIVERTPSVEDVQKWVSDARGRTPTVVK